MREPAFAAVAEVPIRGVAEVLVGKLRAHGLDALIQADNCGGAYPMLDSFRVVVPADEAVRARWILGQTEDPL